MSDNRDTREPSKDLGGPGRERSAGREQQVMLLGGRICGVIGVLVGIAAIVFALFGGTANVSAGALGAFLGILAYFLGSSRLGLVTVVLCVFAIFFGLAASQGYIPGIGVSDRGLPAIEPSAE